jgi:hypothetical protein
MSNRDGINSPDVDPGACGRNTENENERGAEETDAVDEAKDDMPTM